MNSEVIELKNGLFIDVVKGKYFQAGTRILISKGRITAILAHNESSKDYQPIFSIDLKGKTVIPGMINTHVHLQMVLPSLMSNIKDIILIKRHGMEQIEKAVTDCLLHGITHIRDAWTEDLRLNQYLKDRIKTGKLKGPRIYQSVLVSPLGGSFSPEKSQIEKILFSLLGMSTVKYNEKYSGTVVFSPEADSSEVRYAVDKAIDERKAEYIKFYDQKEKRLSYKAGATMMTYKQLAAACDQAGLRKIMSTMHHLTVDSFRRAVAVGVKSLVHLPYDKLLTNDDIKNFIDSGCTLEPTASLMTFLCYKMNEDKYNNHPNMNILTNFRNEHLQKISWRFWKPELNSRVVRGLKRANNGNMRLAGIWDMSFIFKYYSGYVAKGMMNLLQLYKAGARIALANDAGAVPCTPAMLGHEIQLLNLFLNQQGKIFDGLSALRSATINGAYGLGIEKDYGSIELGKAADLVVIDGDPLDDWRLLGKPVQAVIMDGHIKINNCGLKKIQR